METIKYETKKPDLFNSHETTTIMFYNACDEENKNLLVYQIDDTTYNILTKIKGIMKEETELPKKNGIDYMVNITGINDILKEYAYQGKVIFSELSYEKYLTSNFACYTDNLIKLTCCELEYDKETETFEKALLYGAFSGVVYFGMRCNCFAYDFKERFDDKHTPSNLIEALEAYEEGFGKYTI